MGERPEPAPPAKTMEVPGWSAGQLIAAAYRIAERHLTTSNENR